MANPTITATADVDNAVIEISVAGSWGRQARSRLWDLLHKCLAERPRAVLVDVTDLHDSTGSSAATLLNAQRAAAQLDPPVRLAVCAPEGAAGRALRRSVPVHHSLDDARTALANTRPLSRSEQARYEPDIMSVPAARNLAGDACLTWNLPDLAHPARQVVSELATNAVEHAATPFVVTVSRRGRLVHLAVQDHSPTMPVYTRPAPYEPGDALLGRGFGLQTVHRLATAWGYLPTRDGKVVWATLGAPRTAPPRRVRPGAS